MLNTSNTIWIFFEKNRSFFICFIVLFYPGYDTQFIFFPKIEKATFTDQFYLLIFFLGLKLNFLVDFIKNKKCKRG